jgi:hypothetical protein
LQLIQPLQLLQVHRTLTNKTIDAASNTLSNIANSSLTNSTVSYGGISLALGASDATPAFDLSDATNYPTSSLTGTITNAQLAGSIAVSKTLLTAGTGLTLSTNTLSVDAAQTQITSVGTLGSLTVSGDLTIDTSTLKVDSTNNRVGIGNASPDVTLDIGSSTDAIHMPVGTTAQRPTGAAGYFRYNSDLGQFEGYTDEWGSIAGSGGASAVEQQIFAGTGSQTDFTLTTAPATENNLLVFIDGVFQAQDSYSVSGTTLTFSTAPVSGRVITVYHVRSSVSGANMNIDSMTGDGADTTLTLSVAPVNENNVQVYFDGVYQSKSNYSVSGTTLTFTTAPPSGVAVEAITHSQTDVNVPVDGTITPAKIASGDFYFDTNTLYIDATNNRVGIGTTSPSGALDVTGTVTADNAEVGTGGASNANAIIDLTGDTTYTDFGFRILRNSGANGNTDLRHRGTGNLNIEAVEAGNIVFETTDIERARIDSSGNVLISGTSSSINAGSISLEAQGRIRAGRDGGAVMQLNRTTSDGDIAVFYKDGSTVGSIAASTNLNIGSGGTRIWFRDGTKALRPVSTEIGNGSDGIINIGEVGGRFKDLYLSGGVYLGGTAAANKLDDYEEGTWTPGQGSFDTWSSSPTFTATYTKVGRLVNIELRQTGGIIGWSAGDNITGLPFAPTKGSIGYASDTGPSSDNGPILAWTNSAIYFNFAQSSEQNLLLNIIYETTA